jgi:hypothetical protein
MSTERVRISSELILGEMLRVWLSVNTIPSGFMRCAPSAHSITVGPPRAGFQEGVPRSFGEFLEHGVFGTSEVEAFAWYARMKLRYSCSSLSCTFICFVVPELIRTGIIEMGLPWGGMVLLSNLRVIEVKAAVPLRRYTIELSTKMSEEAAATQRKKRLTLGEAEIAEFERNLAAQYALIPLYVSKGGGEFCRKDVIEKADQGGSLSHNLLRCTETGTFIDFSLGQFTGAMNPDVYKDQDAFTRLIPTDKLYTVYESPEREIDEQNARDIERAVNWPSNPDISPLQFAKRVVHGCEGAISSGVAAFCATCYAGEVPLLQCSQCHCISYCSRPCQKLHWKKHKQMCCKVQSKIA